MAYLFRVSGCLCIQRRFAVLIGGFKLGIAQQGG